MGAESMSANPPPAGPMPMPSWYSFLGLVVSDSSTPEPLREAIGNALSSYGGLRHDRRDLYAEQSRLSIELRRLRALAKSAERLDSGADRTGITMQNVIEQALTDAFHIDVDADVLFVAASAAEEEVARLCAAQEGELGRVRELLAAQEGALDRARRAVEECARVVLLAGLSGEQPMALGRLALALDGEN